MPTLHTGDTLYAHSGSPQTTRPTSKEMPLHFVVMWRLRLRVRNHRCFEVGPTFCSNIALSPRAPKYLFLKEIVRRHNIFFGKGGQAPTNTEEEKNWLVKHLNSTLVRKEKCGKKPSMTFFWDFWRWNIWCLSESLVQGKSTTGNLLRLYKQPIAKFSSKKRHREFEKERIARVSMKAQMIPVICSVDVWKYVILLPEGIDIHGLAKTAKKRDAMVGWTARNGKLNKETCNHYHSNSQAVNVLDWDCACLAVNQKFIVCGRSHFRR